MSRLRQAAAALLLLVTPALSACSDDDDDKLVVDARADGGATGQNDAGVPELDAGKVDSGVDAGNSTPALTSCLARPPVAAPSPPTGALPCDLLPPGFAP